MQLPLIYKTLGKVRIVPVIMPQAEPEALQQIGNAIASVLEPEDLIVISTDLSHFPPRKIATEVDQDAMNSWLTLNPEVIFQTEEKWQKSQKTSTAMCGVAAIVTGISALNKAFNSENLQTLNMHYSDSGTASGDTGRVVGYGSALIVHKTTNLPEKEKADKNKERNAPEPTENKMFNADTRKEMLLIARKTLEQHLSGQKVKIENPGLPELEKNGYGIFVTMKNKGMLRGCIGIFSSEKPLWKLISEFAIASSQDQRFYNNPVTEKELPEIDFEISVLSPLRQIKSYQEAIIGTHGIVIERGWNRGVFLPQVATETGWNLEEFWAHLTRDKAGLPVTLYREPDAQTKLYIFDAEVFGEKAH
jgi:AmmeMemoRadiSam system protein A